MHQGLHAVADRLTLPRSNPGTLRTEPARDIHAVDRILADGKLLEWTLDSVRGGASGAFNPLKTRDIKGMGAVWDYRAFTQPNGGRINPLVFVQHIPVIRQMAGRADLDALWRVLISQRLMVQRATDGEGNVAKYTGLRALCFHARGANAISAGVEHMHLTTADSWTDRQLNAAAYCAWEAHDKCGIPLTRARLGDGAGLVKVRRRGQTTHEAVSRHAQFFDRSDPGELYEDAMGEVRDRALFFGRMGRF